MAKTLTHRQLTETIVADLSSQRKLTESLVKDMSNNRQLTEKLVVEVVAIKDYMFEHMATKVELRETENRLMTHIDGLYKRSDTHDAELTAGRARTERLEGRVSTVENTLGIA